LHASRVHYEILMHQAIVSLFMALLLYSASTPERAQKRGSSQQPVKVGIETNLASDSGQIRQFAFDGDPDTFFASAEAAGTQAHFTLVFDAPVAVSSIAVRSGRAEGGDKRSSGTLDISADGKKFEELGNYIEGSTRQATNGRKIKAIRLRPEPSQKRPLVLRELTVESDPPLATFKYPVEFEVDAADAPELSEWADQVARVCERAYPMINEVLRSEGFTPPHLIHLALKSRYKGVAATSGNRIVGSVKYFTARRDDVGALIHETAHVVQHYQGHDNPGWLVEGVADYVRFFKFEPGKIGPIDPKTARYDRSYRVSAAFLDHVANAYDKAIVGKLNAVLREGAYAPEVFEKLTGKTLEQLDEEWRQTLLKSGSP
jgi:hypothetical protein